jgi:hypothetical protein
MSTHGIGFLICESTHVSSLHITLQAQSPLVIVYIMLVDKPILEWYHSKPHHQIQKKMDLI